VEEVKPSDRLKSVPIFLIMTILLAAASQTKWYAMCEVFFLQGVPGFDAEINDPMLSPRRLVGSVTGTARERNMHLMLIDSSPPTLAAHSSAEKVLVAIDPYLLDTA
jgi:hypothetical protein